MAITIYRKQFQQDNSLVAEVGSNCPQGGDSGHGGRTILSFEDTGATVLDVVIRDQLGNEQHIEDVAQVTLIFGGDSEHGTLVQALEFMLGVLRKDATTLESATTTRMEDVG